MSELAAEIPRLPQALVNVRGVDKSRAATDEVLSRAVAAAEEELAGSGRVLLRASGTESMVRVMAEAATQEQADEVTARLAQVVRDRLAI